MYVFFYPCIQSALNIHACPKTRSKSGRKWPDIRCKAFFSHLWRNHVLFLLCRFGRVQSVKLLGVGTKGNNENSEAATVAFMDITSALKAQSVEHNLEDRVLRTCFYDPRSGAESESGPGPGGGASVGSAGVGGRIVNSVGGTGSVTGIGSSAPSSAVQARLHG